MSFLLELPIFLKFSFLPNFDMHFTHMPKYREILYLFFLGKKKK